MINTIRITTIACLLVLLFSSNVFGEEKTGFIKRAWRKLIHKKTEAVSNEITLQEQGVSEELPVEGSPWEKVTNEEIIDMIKGAVKHFPEARSAIPKLKVVEDKEGNIEKMEYEADGGFADLQEMDKETLIELYNKISIERTNLQVERIHSQLQTVQMSQRIPQVPQTPPQPPVMHTPPPASPRQPYIPQPPPQPPQPPRR